MCSLTLPVHPGKHDSREVQHSHRPKPVGVIIPAPSAVLGNAWGQQSRLLPRLTLVRTEGQRAKLPSNNQGAK